MSQKLDACLLAIKTKTGTDLDKATQKELVDLIQSKIDDAARSGRSIEIPQLVKSAEDALKEAHFNKIRTQTLNAAAGFTNFNKIVTNYADHPGVGLATTFKDINADRFGGRESIPALTQGIRQKYISTVNSKLIDKDLLKLATSNKIEKEINEAVHLMNSPGGKDLSHLPKEAVEIARILNEAMDAARLEANKFGANIGKLDGYVQPQTHDQHRIGKAGGHAYGSAEAKAAWIKDIVEIGLDVDRTFKGASTNAIADILGSMFDQFANGYHLKFGDDVDSGVRGLSSTAKKLSHERKLYFKDAESTFNYNQKYGSEPTVYGGIMSALNSIGRDIAIMQKLGPSGIVNIDKLAEKLEKHFHNLNEPKKVLEIRKNLEDIKKNLWPEITGLNSIPVNAIGADIGGISRKIFEGGMLGTSAIASIPDAGMAGSVARQFTTRDKQAFFGAMNNFLGELFNGLDAKETKQVASLIGVYLDHVNPSMGVDASMKGKMGMLSDLYYKANLLTPWTQKVKIATAKYVSHFQAMNIKKSFDQLPAGMQAGLRQFGITPEEWGVVGASKLFKDSRGREYVNVKSFKEIDLRVTDSIPDVRQKLAAIDLLKNASEEKKLDLKNAVRSDALNTLENKYTSMINEISAMGATEPGSVERAYMFGGTRRGTLIGESVRSVSQFKSFTVTGMRKHLFRETMGYTDKIQTPAESMRAMFTSQNNGSMAGFATMIASGTMLGVLANSLKDITKGLEPRIPEDPVEFGKILTEGLVRSGGLGFYGDFLFGNVLQNRHGQDPLTALLGPTAGFVSDTFKLAGELKSTAIDGESFSKAQAIKYFKSYTPGVNTLNNHFATSYLANKLIFGQIQEYLNPGYLRKYEQNLKNNADKEYIRIESLGIDMTPSNDNIFNN